MIATGVSAPHKPEGAGCAPAPSEQPGYCSFTLPLTVILPSPSTFQTS